MKLCLDIFSRAFLVSIILIMDYKFINIYLEHYQNFMPWQILAVAAVAFGIIWFFPFKLSFPRDEPAPRDEPTSNNEYAKNNYGISGAGITAAQKMFPQKLKKIKKK
ncbi:MAG: hypothetical protein KBC57_00295 [Neisseriaceae bacterium]|nr:hypothetical protein [Neisseriaceae bacterium]